MCAALATTLGKLTPEDLATHAAALAAKLEDTNICGTYAANEVVSTLGNLSPKVCATYASAIAAKLKDLWIDIGCKRYPGGPI
eukprot:5326042-Prymnesium_polylepis.1